jgi:hypothetical protein
MRIDFRGMAITLAALSLAGSAVAAPVETVLHNFTGYPNDGAYPIAGLIADKEGALYGTTQEGGNNGCNGYGCGTVFKLTPPAKGRKAQTQTFSIASRAVATAMLRLRSWSSTPAARFTAPRKWDSSIHSPIIRAALGYHGEAC